MENNQDHTIYTQCRTKVVKPGSFYRNMETLLRDFIIQTFQKEFTKVQIRIKKELHEKYQELSVCVTAIEQLKKERIYLLKMIDNEQSKRIAMESEKKCLADRVKNLAEQVRQKIQDASQMIVCEELSGDGDTHSKETTNDMEEETCSICNLSDPPNDRDISDISDQAECNIDWTGCDCGQWFHNKCINVKNPPEDFSCRLLKLKCTTGPSKRHISWI